MKCPTMGSDENRGSVHPAQTNLVAVADVRHEQLDGIWLVGKRAVLLQHPTEAGGRDGVCEEKRSGIEEPKGYRPPPPFEHLLNVR